MSSGSRKLTPEPGSVRVESTVRCLAGMRVQAEQLTAADGEDGVVEPAIGLILVQDRAGAEQRGVPLGASFEVADRHRNVGEAWEVRHVLRVLRMFMYGHQFVTRCVSLVRPLAADNCPKVAR
jgi:hypothetical protein